jgi:hypothetical protein
MGRRASGGVDPTTVMIRRTVRFLGTAVTVERHGPDGGDSRKDGAVPKHGGYGQAAWTQRW